MKWSRVAVFEAVSSIAVTIRYSIIGVDNRQAAAPWTPTIGLRDGRWVVTGMTSVRYPLGVGGQPWQGGPIATHSSDHVMAVVSRGHETDLAPRLLRLAERALVPVLAFRPDSLHGKVLMIAVDDPAVFESYYPGDWAAYALPVYSVVPEWEPKTELLTMRMRLNPKYFNLTDDKVLEILAHELTHVATGDITGGRTPTWLVEGVANYVSYPLGKYDQSKVAREIRRIGIPHTLPSEASFYQDNDNYLLAWLACRMIRAVRRG